MDIYNDTMELYAREMGTPPTAEMQECFEGLELTDENHKRDTGDLNSWKSMDRIFAGRKKDIKKAIFEDVEVEEILEEANKRKEEAFILVLDGIEDVHNLGSIIRTAETAGVHGIIIPKRRAAAVNGTVSKTSAGAVEYMKIARVNNINDTIRYLKENGVWICGTDMNTEKVYYEQDYNMPIAIVIGNEGKRNK